MTLHTERKRFQTKVQKKRIHGTGLRSHIAHEVRTRLRDISRLAELLCVGNTVIGLIGLRKHRELSVIPVKASAVNNAAADLNGMTVHIFGRGMCNDIGAKSERTAIDGRREGIIDDQRHSVAVGRLCKQFQIRHDKRRIGESFGKHTPCIFTECGVQFFLRAVRIHKSALNAHFVKRLVEQIEGAAVNSAGADNMAARMADIQDSDHGCGLTGRSQHRTDASLQCSDLLLNGIQRWVAQTGVEEARILKVKQTPHRLRSFIPEGGALYNRHHARLSVSRMISCMNALCIHTILAHFQHSLIFHNPAALSQRLQPALLFIIP